MTQAGTFWTDELIGLATIVVDGTPVPRRTTTRFVSGVGVAIAVTDDEENNATELRVEATGTTPPVTLAGEAHTLGLVHAGALVGVSHDSAATLTVPPNADVPIAIGSRIAVYQAGAGQVTITAGAGVTIRTAEPTTKLRAQWSRAELCKLAANEWLLAGDLAAS